MGEYTSQLMKNVGHWFDLADKILDSEDCPLWQRPLRAALYTAEVGVERNYDRTISKYEDLLVGHLLNAAREWYHARYGKENCQSTEEIISGAVLFRNIPVALSIPIISRRLEIDDEHVRITFLTQLISGEEATSFLSSELPIASLSSRARLSFEKKIKAVVTSTRTICTSARIVNCVDRPSRDMCHSVVERLDIGVALLLRGNSRSRALAIWEFFFVIELLLKTFISQRGELPARIHVLKDLEATAVKLGLSSPLAQLADLPSSGKAIQHRYAQREATILEAMRIYNATLNVGLQIISELKLGFHGQNPAVVMIRNPGWLFPPA
jgi:hypothetical protein